MKLGYTILYVASVTDTIAFYEQAFGLQRGMVTEKANMVNCPQAARRWRSQPTALPRRSRAFRPRSPTRTGRHLRSS